MNKQALATLTIEQLRQHKETLAKRIDGRENIRLAEEYKVHREQAEKIKQGKATRIRRAKHFTKNIYLQNEGQSYSHIQRVQKVKKEPNKEYEIFFINIRSISSGGLKLNDLYKVGKSKLTGWWGSSNNNSSNNAKNVNEERNNNYYPEKQYNVDKNSTIEQAYEIIIDCPPVEVMREPENVEKDPMLQEISQIIRQQEHKKDENGESFTEYQEGSKQGEKEQYRPYERLYNKEDDQRYIYEEQRVYHYDNHHGINQEQKIEKEQKKEENKKEHPNRKNFEFDDLPGMGWRKLKGLVGFGGSSSKKNKSKEIDVNVNVNVNNVEQQQQQYYTQQQQQYINDQQLNYQSHKENTQQYNQQQHQQRKRIPIFSPLYNITSEITTHEQNEDRTQMQQEQLQEHQEQLKLEHENQQTNENDKNEDNDNGNDDNLANEMIETKDQEKL